MSHYDCDNCGYYGGIGYGICENCTPEAVLHLRRDLNVAMWKAEREFEKIFEEQKTEFIKVKTQELSGIYEVAYEQGLNSRYRKYTRG